MLGGGVGSRFHHGIRGKAPGRVWWNTCCEESLRIHVLTVDRSARSSYASRSESVRGSRGMCEHGLPSSRTARWPTIRMSLSVVSGVLRVRCIVTVGQRTTFLNAAKLAGDHKPQWFVLDASGMTVGRIATQIATVLMGKHKPTYSPHVDSGDYVIVLNADKVQFVGGEMKHPEMPNFTTKTNRKEYFRHSEFPGGLKRLSAEQMWAKHPTSLLEQAVRRMLPKNALARHQLDKLKLFASSEHPHQAQNPQPFPEHLLRS